MESRTPRPSWDSYYCDLAKTAATRSTCARLAVGTVIVRDRIVLATGYNGSVSHAPHCLDVGCVTKDGHCISSVHSEQNAISQAAKIGTSIAYSTAYITVNPCLRCYQLLIQAGIKRIVYIEKYGDVDYDMLKLSSTSAPEMTMLGSSK